MKKVNVGNEEKIEDLLSLQNILNNRQIAADIEEKLANKGEIPCRGISRIYLSLSNK